MNEKAKRPAEKNQPALKRIRLELKPERAENQDTQEAFEGDSYQSGQSLKSLFCKSFLTWLFQRKSLRSTFGVFIVVVVTQKNNISRYY